MSGLLPDTGQTRQCLQLQTSQHLFLPPCGHQRERCKIHCGKEEARKRISPSTQRRNARRKEELNDFKSENSLKIHIGKVHKKGDSTPPLQHLGSPATMPTSPLLDASKKEVAEVVMEEPTPPHHLHPPGHSVRNPSPPTHVRNVRRISQVYAMTRPDRRYEHKDCQILSLSKSTVATK